MGHAGSFRCLSRSEGHAKGASELGLGPREAVPGGTDLVCARLGATEVSAPARGVQTLRVGG